MSYTDIKSVEPGFNGSEFGAACAISGDGNTMVVGGQWYGGNLGIAVIYDKDLNGNWNPVYTITGQNGERLGVYVTISNNGNYVLIGSPYYTDNSTFKGEVKLYERSGSSFQPLGQPYRMMNLDTTINSFFISDTLDIVLFYANTERYYIIELFNFTNNTFGNGTILFNQNVMVGLTTITTPVSVSCSRDLSRLLFVATSGFVSTAVVLNVDLVNKTASEPSGWRGTINDTQHSNAMLSGDGNTILFADRNTNIAYVSRYIPSSNNWSGKNSISVNNITANGSFGSSNFPNSLCINYDGNTIGVASPWEVVNGNNFSGVARFWKYTNDSWNSTPILTVSGNSNERLGTAIAIDDAASTILIGVPRYNNSGRVLSYSLPPPDTTPPTLSLTIPEGKTLIVYKDQPIPSGKYILTVSDNNTTPTTSDVTLSGPAINGNSFTSSPGVYQVSWSVTDGDNTTTLSRTVLVLDQAYQAPICFTGNTPITTDQGEIEIKKLIPGIHTINGQEIKDITETVNTEDNLVKIEKGAFSENVPSRETVMTNRHKLYYRGEMVEAGSLVGKRGVTIIDYTGEFVYNVVLSTHTTMNVNGMTCETLDPNNVQYRLMTLHKQMLAGKCNDEVGQEFSRLMDVHKSMCIA